MAVLILLRGGPGYNCKVKILQRNANLEAGSSTPGPPPEQDIPLDVPKKTKLYVEQTSREREQAISAEFRAGSPGPLGTL